MPRTPYWTSIFTVLSLVAGPGAAWSGHSVIGHGLEPLRSDFNAARGHLRAILLASPT
ncbi:MAG TPA: hypothetical protein VGG06_33785 [Thermoanaerobaculia bacterium]|jgi:hypothetical protein